MPSEVEQYADFGRLRYAQCWEDGAVLLAALDPQPHHRCLSIASGGDNTLALLSRGPQRVVAIDLSPAQIACLELKVAAFRNLSYEELLLLVGASFPPADRAQQRSLLYRRCRADLSPRARQFWDQHPQAIADGINSSGKFERYLALFRRRILPLIQPRDRWLVWFDGLPTSTRRQYYADCWDTWGWRWGFRAFFSRWVLGRLGTDPGFLRYGQRSLGEHLLKRTRYALVDLDPATNPYLQWLVFGHFAKVLPPVWQPQNYNLIRRHLDRLEWHCLSLEDYIAQGNPDQFDGCNLSNVFEYMSLKHYHALLPQLHHLSRSGCRWVYWNRLECRSRPDFMADQIRSHQKLAQTLYQQDRVWFYQRLVVEQVVK